MAATKVELKQGDVFETVFEPNGGKQKEAFPYRATRINGRKADKVVLCADPKAGTDQTLRVEVVRVKRPGTAGRGFIEVKRLGPVRFELDPDIYLSKTIARKLEVFLEAGFSILLDGPQGTGKTVLSRSIAKALDMTYVYFNCASVYDATDFIATIYPATENGKVVTKFLTTDIHKTLLEALDKPHRRFLVFLDEFNRCRPMARNGLMPALDSTRKVFDPTTNEMLEIPGNVQFCAAINNGDQFAGAGAVDPAQMDRFATLKLDYLPPAEEDRLLAGRYPQVEKEQLRQVVAAAHAVRRDKELGVDLSMRATEEACVLLSHPLFKKSMTSDEALRDVLETAFCGRFPGRIDDPGSEAGMVWEVIVKALKRGGNKG